jgi:signal transduction histidine kinase
VVSGRGQRRGLGRITLRQKLVAVGGAGIILTLVVMQSALSGLGAVNHDHRTVDRIRQAQRLHQDADMMHDALRADAYNALLASAGLSADSSLRALAEFDAHALEFQQDLDGIAAVRLSGPAGEVLKRTRPVEEGYIASGRHLAQLAMTDKAAAEAATAPFERLFDQVAGVLAGATAQIAQAADAAEADARGEVGLSQQRILLASGAALAGLMAMAFMLSRLGRQLSDALTELEAHVEAVTRSEQRSRDFLAYAAHQLRTPISTTRASAEALLLKGASPGQEDLLSALVRETGRAGRLVTALLRMARLDQGEVPARQPCDVAELCRTEVERMEARSPTLRWLLEADGSIPALVPLSPEGTGEALSNLLDNARRHALGEVRVRVSMRSGVLVISVHDDGPGLPEGARSAVFERFVSLDGHGGSGLGLPIARGLAEAQGGTLDYEDGSFVMRLPVPDTAAGAAG